MAIGKFNAVTSLFQGQGDIVVGKEFKDSEYTDELKVDALFATAQSVGQVKEGSSEWTGDEPTIEPLKDEQGDVITSRVTAGTNSFAFTMANVSKEVCEAFLKALKVENAFSTDGVFGSGGTAMKIVDLPITTRPIFFASEDFGKALVFPKAKIVSSLIWEDGLLSIRASVTAEYIDTEFLGSCMLLHDITIDYGTASA